MQLGQRGSQKKKRGGTKGSNFFPFFCGWEREREREREEKDSFHDDPRCKQIFKYLLDFSRINSGLIFSISIGLAYVYRCDTGLLCTQNRNYLAEYRLLVCERGGAGLISPVWLLLLGQCVEKRASAKESDPCVNDPRHRNRCAV